MTLSPYQIVNAFRATDDARATQNENSPRIASEMVKYETVGVGQTIVPGALRFSTTFLEPPAVVTGTVMTRPPGTGWSYPIVSAGVYRWLLDAKGYTIGAYVYFNVRCEVSQSDFATDLLQYVRYRQEELEQYRTATASAIEYWKSRLATVERGSNEAAQVKRELLLARQDLERYNRIAAWKAPNPAITHHLLFQGLAMKELPEDVTGLLG